MQRPGTQIAADRAGTGHTHYGHTIITYDGNDVGPLFESQENQYLGPVTINWFVYPVFSGPTCHHYFGPVTINYIGPGTYGATMPGGHHYSFAEPVTINYVEGVANQPNQPLESRDGRSHEHAPCGYNYSRLACGAPVPGCMPALPNGYRALNLFELAYLRQSSQEEGSVAFRLINSGGPGTNGGYTATENGDYPAAENGGYPVINGGHWGFAGDHIWFNGGEQGVDGGHLAMHNGGYYGINDGQHGLNGGQYELDGVQHGPNGGYYEINDGQPELNGARHEPNGVQPWTNGGQHGQPELNGARQEPNGVQHGPNGGQPWTDGGQHEQPGLNGVQHGQPQLNGARHEPNGGQGRTNGTQLVWGRDSREWYPPGQSRMGGTLQAEQPDEPGSPAQNGRAINGAE